MNLHITDKMAQRGVTLVELLVVIAIIGILTRIAIPSYRSIMTSTKISAIASDLHSTLLLARSEALKQGFQTVVCASTDSSTCSATLDANVGWGAGWIAYVIKDSSSNAPSATNAIFFVANRYMTNASQGSISSNVPNNALVFGVTGQTYTTTQFVINAPTGFSDATRAVCVSRGGRIRVEKASACA